MESVLVTGASGFIGSFIVEEALRRGFGVWAGIRSSSSREYLQDKKIHFLELDFAHPGELFAQLSGHKELYGKFEVVLIYTFCSSGTVDNVIELTIQFLMTGKLRTKLTGMRKVEFKKMYLLVLQILPAAGRTDDCPYAESPPQRLFHDETPDKPACSCY